MHHINTSTRKHNLWFLVLVFCVYIPSASLWLLSAIYKSHPSLEVQSRNSSHLSEVCSGAPPQLGCRELTAGSQRCRFSSLLLLLWRISFCFASKTFGPACYFVLVFCLFVFVFQFPLHCH